MKKPDIKGSEARFEKFVERLGRVLGHKDREEPLKDYCVGLMAAPGRKSVEPLAAVAAPARVPAQHQSLLHLVGQSPWSDAAVLTEARRAVLPAMERHGLIKAWIIDDTGFPKKGKHAVGVARQYCGQLGKQDNCQVAVSLSIANHAASLPIAFRLYLPKEWARDRERRKRAGVPAKVTFATKPAIALEQIRQACAADIPRGVVLMDVGYGADTSLRDGVSALGLMYAAGILPNTTVWAQGHLPLSPEPPAQRRKGRRQTRLRRDAAHQPITVKALAMSLPQAEWQTITWREGTNDALTGRFARLRVRPAHRDYHRAAPRPEEWLIIEWPEGQPEPEKYWLSTLPTDTPFDTLIATIKLRWRIERDYRELKQEAGLSDYEGRGWRGFHHHATLCIAAYGFLISEQETIPPSGFTAAMQRKKLAFSPYRRPLRSTASSRAPHAKLYRHTPSPPHHGARSIPAPLPLLRSTLRAAYTQCRFVTQ